MQIKIKRFDKTLPLPTYKTRGAVALDLCARVNTEILANQIGYIPLNVAIEIPENCWVMVAARGSTHKSGILPVHGFGIGDWDYCGDNDEYLFPVLNFTDKTVVIEKGSRVAQMMINKYEKVDILEVDKLEGPDRGGFGTTGVK